MSKYANNRAIIVAGIIDILNTETKTNPNKKYNISILSFNMNLRSKPNPTAGNIPPNIINMLPKDSGIMLTNFDIYGEPK